MGKNGIKKEKPLSSSPRVMWWCNSEESLKKKKKKLNTHDCKSAI